MFEEHVDLCVRASLLQANPSQDLVCYFPSLLLSCPPSLEVTPGIVKGHFEKIVPETNTVALCSGQKDSL